MGLMTMVSRKMLNKKVVVTLGSGVMKGIEMEGILRGYDLVLDTIQLEKNGHVHTYDEGVTSIEVVEVEPQSTELHQLQGLSQKELSIVREALTFYCQNEQVKNKDKKDIADSIAFHMEWGDH